MLQILKVSTFYHRLLLLRLIFIQHYSILYIRILFRSLLSFYTLFTTSPRRYHVECWLSFPRFSCSPSLLFFATSQFILSQAFPSTTPILPLSLQSHVPTGSVFSNSKFPHFTWLPLLPTQKFQMIQIRMMKRRMKTKTFLSFCLFPLQRSHFLFSSLRIEWEASSTAIFFIGRLFLKVNIATILRMKMMWGE